MTTDVSKLCTVLDTGISLGNNSALCHSTRLKTMLFCLQLCLSLHWGKATEFQSSQLVECIIIEDTSDSMPVLHYH